VRNTGGENIDQQGYCGVSRAWGLALSAEKSGDLGWRLSHPLHQEGRSGVGGVLFLIPAWEVQLDTLSCMSTSIQSD
jgi:hypothetical protein